jgi:hypothetical protein
VAVGVGEGAGVSPFLGSSFEDDLGGGVPRATQQLVVATGEAAFEQPPPAEDMSEEELGAEATPLADAIQEELGDRSRVIYVP